MGSVSSSLNPGVADLLQTLSNLNSPVMSSPSAVTALEKAPPGDIVQLSAAALQLQTVDAMFGISTGSNTNMSSSLLTSLENSATAPGTAAASGQAPSTVLSTASPADQLANYQAALQAEQTQGLFGATPSSGLTGSLFNAIA